MKIPVYVSLKDKLEGEYLETFNFVEHYGELHMVGSKVMAEKMMDLMDLMLEAQEHGTPVKHVVGKNVRDYCKNYFSDVTVFDMLKDMAKQLCIWAWLLFSEIICMILEIGNKDFHFFSYKIDVSGYLFGIMIAWSGLLLADFVGIILAKFGNYSQKVWNISAIGGTVAAVCLAILFGFEMEGAEMLGWPLVLFSGLYLLIYYGVIFWWRYKTTGSFRKQKNEYETSFTGMVKNELVNTDYGKDKMVVRAFAKRYIRVNKRYVRKGQEPLTTAAFFEREKEKNKKSVWVGPIVGGISLVCSLGYGLIDSFVLPGASESESFFASPSEVPIFLAWMGLCMGVPMFFLWRFMKKINKVAELEQNSLLAACQSKGVELDVYYERRFAEKMEEETEVMEKPEERNEAESMEEIIIREKAEKSTGTGEK